MIVRRIGPRAMGRAALSALLLALVPSRAVAGSGVAISLPAPPLKNVAGLSLTLDSQWVEGRGYRPIRIDVRSTPPSAGDRTLSVTVTAFGFPRKFVDVSTDIDIPAGSSQVTHWVTLPQYTMMQALSLEVWEDGIRLKDLCVERSGVPMTGVGRWGSTPPSILFIGPQQTDVSSFRFLVDERGIGNAPISRPGEAATFMARDKADLVSNWINYDSLDLITISYSDVLDMAIRQPKSWQAIRRWVWAGGNLVVFDVGEDWRHLERVEQLLKCPASQAEAALARRGWQEPPALVEGPIAAPPGPGDPPADAKPLPAKDWLTFVSRRAMFGTVVAVNHDPFPGTTEEWTRIFEAIGPSRSRWHFRHGVNMDQANPSFDNMLIADVGLPPVRTYQVLISLFVVAIGPLNYWWLRRQKRLHLLLFSVPAAATLVSLGLLGYVVLADGLESRVRARSLMLLDQRNHEQVVWSRLSYYTGLSSWRGLSFADDTVVTPLEKAPSWGSFGGRVLDLAWTPEQHYSGGALLSRTPTQYVTVRARPSELALDVEHKDGACWVRNRLGTKIQYLFLADAEGKLHFRGNIAAGENAELGPLDNPAAVDLPMNMLDQELRKHAPKFPEAGGTTPQGFFRVRTSAARRALVGNTDGADSSSSLLEVEFARVLGAVRQRQLEPQSYIALVERPADVMLGMDGLLESESTHVIHGTW